MAKKTSTTDIVLSQKELNEEGIKTQLTQNDLLEVIVSEKHKQFTDELEALAATAKMLSEKISADREKLDKKAQTDVVKKYNLSVDLDKCIVSTNGWSTCISDSKTNPTKSVELTSLGVLLPTTVREKGVTQVTSTSIRSINVPVKPGTKLYKHYGLTIKEKTKIADNVTLQKEYNITQYTLEYTTNEYLKLIEEVKKHNVKVAEFCERYKGMNVSYEAILKEMRVTFNKSLIANSAPGLRKKIKGVFHIELA